MRTLTDIIKLRVTPASGFEMDPEQVSDWILKDGKYERSGFVKDFIGMKIVMGRQEVTKYTIDVLSNNISWGGTTGSGSYPKDSTIGITATPKDGYIFAGWQDGNTDNPRNVVVTSNKTYIANFAVEYVTYKILVNVKSGQSTLGTVTGGGTYREGTEHVIEAIPNAGCKFVQWSDGNTEAQRTIIVNSDKTYTAEFVSVQYNIKVNSNNIAHGTVTGGGTYIEGSTAHLKATANTGYRFTGWNDGNTEPERDIVVKGPATYTAYFEEIPQVTANITVKSADAGKGYTIPSGTNKYNIGDKIMIQAFSNAGFEFVKWKETGSSDVEFEHIVGGDATFTAMFESTGSTTHIVRGTCDPANGGSINGIGTYTDSSLCTLTATPKEGYDFAGWSVGGETIMNNPYTFTVVNDINVTALFTPKGSSGNIWDVFVKSGELWMENEKGTQIRLANYVDTQGDTINFDVSGLSSVTEGNFTMSYTDDKGAEAEITENGIYADFNTSDNLIESIITVTGIAGNDTSMAAFSIKILESELRESITTRFRNGDTEWYKIQ